MASMKVNSKRKAGAKLFKCKDLIYRWFFMSRFNFVWNLENQSVSVVSCSFNVYTYTVSSEVSPESSRRQMFLIKQETIKDSTEELKSFTVVVKWRNTGFAYASTVTFKARKSCFEHVKTVSLWFLLVPWPCRSLPKIYTSKYSKNLKQACRFLVRVWHKTKSSSLWPVKKKCQHKNEERKCCFKIYFCFV